MQKSASNKVNMSKNKASSLKKTEAESRKEELSSAEVENDFEPPLSAPEKSENVKVAVRIRPMNESEVSRADQPCLNA